MDERFPDPFAGQSAWTPRPPRGIVPVPAAAPPHLRGKRVITGLPGFGWRADLRADNRVVQGSRTYVPVIPEQEWYRAEAEQIEVFAPLVPAERVWVEEVGEHGGRSRPGPCGAPAQSRSTRLPPSADSRVLCRVGDRAPGGADVEGAEQRDLRAVTEAYTGADGDICVRVAPSWTGTAGPGRGQPPKTLEVPVHELWVE